MIELYHNENDLTNYVISYTRKQEICTGIGNIDVVLAHPGYFISVWDTFTLYENGRKKGTYFVSTFDRDDNNGILTITGQDASKMLQDYFVDDMYTTDGATNTGAVIVKYLNEVGITYSITGGDGVPLEIESSWGPGSAYDIIMELLQHSGWYMYFDPNNTCIIGDLDVRPGTPETILTDATILDIRENRNDEMLRNKSLVIGGHRPGSDNRITASKQTITPWNYDENDIRTIAVINSNIKDSGSANEIANKLLQEFSKLTEEKEVNLAGPTVLELGDWVLVNSQHWYGNGLITFYGSTFGAQSGLVTNIILDQRCPRLFGFWKDYPNNGGGGPGEDPVDYVYTGHNGDGIYRKAINGSTWEDYSQGLTLLGSKYTKDLAIKNGVAVCVGTGGMVHARSGGYGYIRKETEDSWTHISHGSFTGSDEYTHFEHEMDVAACAIMDDKTIVLGINFTPFHEDEIDALGDKSAWVVGYDVDGNEKFRDQVIFTIQDEIEGELEVTNVNIYDIDVSGSTIFVSTDGLAQPSGYSENQFSHYDFGATKYPKPAGSNKNVINVIAKEGVQDFSETYSPIDLYFSSEYYLLLDKWDEDILYAFNEDYLTIFNLSTLEENYYYFTRPTQYTDELNVTYIRQKSETQFDLILQKAYHAEYTLGDETLDAPEIPNTVPYEDRLASGVVGDIFYSWGRIADSDAYHHTWRLYTYNLDSRTSTTEDINARYKVYDETLGGWGFIDDPPSEWGWVEPIPDPVTIINTTGYHEEFVDFQIPGENYVTVGVVWDAQTEWERNREYSIFVPFPYIGDHINFTKNETKCLYFHIRQDNDGYSTVSTAPAFTFAIQQRQREDGWGSSKGMEGGFRTDGYDAVAGGNGALWIQNEIYEDRIGYITDAIYHVHAYVFDEYMNVIKDRYLTYNHDDGYEWDFTTFFQPYGVHSTNYGRIYVPDGPRGIASKFYGSKSISKVFTNYSQQGETYYYVLRDTSLNYMLFEEDNDEGIPKNTDLQNFALQDDDSNGAIYVETDSDAYTDIKGIIFGSGVVTTLSGVSVGAFYGLLRNFLYTPYGTLEGGYDTGPPCRILTHTAGGSFDHVLETGFNAKLEINKGTPIEAFHKVQAAATYSQFIYQSANGAAGGWTHIQPNYPVYDLRTCDITNPTQFVTVSGSLGTEYKWCLFGTRNEIRAFPTSLASPTVQTVIVTQASGSVTNVETTNYNGNPYIFAAVSGYAIDRTSDTFLQRGPTASGFIDVSAGLPPSYITNIRVDDRI